MLGLLVFCFLCAFFHVSDVDVGYHIRTGEHIMAGNGIPSQNTFSYTVPNEPWLAQQWMPATLYALIHRAGGVPALNIFKALIATLLMFLVWCGARDAAGKTSFWPLWVVTAAVLILRVRFFERPDLFTSALFALVVLLDNRIGTDRRWQWIYLPLLMGLWANIHAGYVYGFVLLTALAGAEWLEFLFPKLQSNPSTRAGRPSVQSLLIRPIGIALSIVTAIVSVQLINPNGWRVLTVPFTQFLSNFWQSVILEYYPPTWGNSKLLFLWLAALILLQALTWRQLRLRYLVASAAFGYFALSSQRSLSAFVIVSAPHAAYMLSRLPRFGLANLARLPRVILPVSWAALVGLVIVPDRTFQFGTGLFHPYYPTEILQFVEREVPPQNIFNEMRYGGPMLWTLYPRFKPFIDGRGDAYSEEFWKNDYLPAVKGEERWAEIFEKYHVTGALLPIPEPTRVPHLARILFAHPDWALVSYNDETLLFLKRTETNLAIIQRHSFAHLWPGNWNFGEISATNLPVMAAEAARAWETHPGNYAHAVAARCAMISGDFAGAAAMFGYIVKRPDASAAFWSDYAYCLYASRQHDVADRVLNDMIHRQLAVGFAYYIKHYIALENNQTDEAKAFLAKALIVEPDNTAYREAWLRIESRASVATRRPSA